MKFNDPVKIIKPGFYENAGGILIKAYGEEDHNKDYIKYKVRLYNSNIEEWFYKKELKLYTFEDLADEKR